MAFARINDDSDDGTREGSGSNHELDSFELLSVPEASALLGVSPGLVRRLTLLDPSFPVVRLGRLIRVHKGALAVWVRQSGGRRGRK